MKQHLFGQLVSVPALQQLVIPFSARLSPAAIPLKSPKSQGTWHQQRSDHQHESSNPAPAAERSSGQHQHVQQPPAQREERCHDKPGSMR
ncbi:hypothetical protein NDU88_007266 [Pleurodeles waltl]|uniref:Uncharacterized protein n=1 Tax=Pleurodeles waltl TaxID=8319 RepID=A0AAV7RR93_PLEWA|nr:hypothetical protein NDU88_007266 [Pleurodeles waltl]